MSGTDASNAKQSLLTLDTVLKRSHLIIGGLAVAHFHPTRVSKDVDLVCDHGEIADAIEAIFPSNLFNNVELNQDDLRPAYVIQSRTDNEKIYFYGPKIRERDAYKYIDWEYIQQDSVPFSYKGIRCKNIVLPNVEKLSFLKLISMLDRLETNPEKGQKDLLDFVNLSNNNGFRANYFYDILRQTKCIKHVVDRTSSLKDKMDLGHLEKSGLFEIFQILYPNPEKRDERLYNRVYDVNESHDFYEAIAHSYDERNTELRYKAHQRTVGAIRGALLHTHQQYKIVDLGCGTGKIIASSFVHSENITWVGVDYSEKMLSQFCQNMDENSISFSSIESDIQTSIPVEEIMTADVVLLCFVLTTSHAEDMLAQIMRSIKPGGSLIISDIHPYYTTKRPFYDFQVPNDRFIAFKPNPIYPDIIEQLASECGLVRASYELIFNRDRMPYSFLLNLIRPAPTDV